MTNLDVAAQERLAEITSALHEAGVTDLFERVIARVWKINVDRFEPDEVGDTSRSLGITASENIRTLVLREAWTAGGAAGLGRDVRVTAPNDSLLVQAGRIRLHVMKSAPAIALTEPRWETEFTWKGESDVRIEAATANTAVYNPFLAVPGGLFEDLLPPVNSAANLREVILIWAGGANSPVTGGWLGLPVLGDRPWLAVENLWWHGAAAPTGESQADSLLTDAFTDRATPSPVVSLKQWQKTAEQ